MNNIRFKILVFFFSLLTPIVSLGQYSCFDMIKSNRLPLTSFNRPDEKAYQNFERLIDQLFVSDQKVRSMDTKHFFKYAPIVASGWHTCIIKLSYLCTLSHLLGKHCSITLKVHPVWPFCHFAVSSNFE